MKQFYRFMEFYAIAMLFINIFACISFISLGVYFYSQVPFGTGWAIASIVSGMAFLVSSIVIWRWPVREIFKITRRRE